LLKVVMLLHWNKLFELPTGLDVTFTQPLQGNMRHWDTQQTHMNAADKKDSIKEHISN
jgi:hypothetical protein